MGRSLLLAGAAPQDGVDSHGGVRDRARSGVGEREAARAGLGDLQQQKSPNEEKVLLKAALTVMCSMTTFCLRCPSERKECIGAGFQWPAVQC